MKRRLLIVDDEKSILDRFTSYLLDAEFEVATAQSSTGAIELAKEFFPDAATIDFSIDDLCGNDVAQELRKINPEIKLAGITYGAPESFDKSLFDIREHKSLQKGDYLEIVNLLMTSENPGAEYSRSQASDEFDAELTSAYLLVQGFNIARNLQKGIQPVEGITLPVPHQEEIILELMDWREIGFEPLNVYARLCARDTKLADDKVLNRFFTAVHEKRYGDVSEDDALHAEDVMYKALGGEE